MKRLTLVVLCLLPAVAGCLTPGPKNYTHATKSQDDYRRERYDCETNAKDLAGKGMLPISMKMSALDAETDRCLREKYGWTPGR